MDDYTIETRYDRMFVAMPRDWLKEAVIIENYIARKENYENDPVTTGAYDSTTTDNKMVHSTERINQRNSKF